MAYTAIAVSILIILTHPAYADDASNRNAQTILHMLDYISVDYGGSVLYGKALNEREYQEQLEFAEQAAALMKTLPEHAIQATLIVKAAEIAGLVKEKAPADHVSLLAQQLHKSVIETYQVPVSPHRLPETLPALALYQQLCIPCHGSGGHGDGPLSKAINPKPANFHDEVRMDQRSVYGLYNSISLGVGRTAMTAFTQLSDEDRWALAFLVSNFRATTDQIEQGQKLWEKRNYQGPTPDLAALTTLTANEISTRYGDQTKMVFTYLISEPKALLEIPHATLIFATEQLDLALTRYREGNKAAAQNLAIAAYLEGFQPIEISLDSLDVHLRRNIESEMMNVRQLISSGMPVETLQQKIDQTKVLLKQSDELLREGKLSVAKAFVSSISILLRESLEGVLVLSALMAFVVKYGQRKALLYVYSGWWSAFLLGVLTWAFATWMMEISGISREITSGIIALITSAMLIYFGIWLYKKTYGQIGQPLQDSFDIFVKRKSLWAFALLSFFVVFRATFEVAFFYESLWIQTAASTKQVLWSGIVTAILVLVSVGWGVFHLGLMLSAKSLFTSTSILLAILSVIFTGQGIFSLQKADIIIASKVDFVSLPMLGIIPTTQTLAAQLVVMGILILGYQISRLQRNKLANPPPTSNV
jgi:high-affinity iron transporter